MSPELIGTVITVGAGLALAVGSSVYAKTRDVMVNFWKEQASKAIEGAKEAVAVITREKDEWKARHESDRKEIHAMREQWNFDKLELERLRAETNFTPIETKLNLFMEGQNRVNQGIMDRMDKMAEAQTEMSKDFTRQSNVFISVVKKLVPALTEDEINEQEKPV